METRCVTGVWQSVGGEPAISVWMVVAGVLVVLLAFAIVFIVKLFRQVATLKYCWMNMSDAYERYATGAVEDSIETVEELLRRNRREDRSATASESWEAASFVSDRIREGGKEWKSILVNHSEVFKRQGIRVGSEADVKWVVLADWW